MLANLAIAMPERIPSTTSTTRSSIRVKPFLGTGIGGDWGGSILVVRNTRGLAHLAQVTGSPAGAGWLRLGVPEQREVLPVSLGLESRDRNEAHCRRVHAVAQAGRLGTVVKNVAKM